MHDCKGIFWTREAAEAAAKDNCLGFLAGKWFREESVHISWEKTAHKTMGTFREVIWARTFHAEKFDRDW